MSDILLEKYARWINPLSAEHKLTLISLISQSLLAKKETPNLSEKQRLFEKLKGSWSEVDDSIERVIYDSRTISDREINFD